MIKRNLRKFTGLPINASESQWAPQASNRVLIWVGAVPKRVGIPNKNPSASGNWSGRIIGISLFLGGACIFVRTSSDNVSATWKTRELHPARSTPARILDANFATWPYIE